MAVPVHGYPFGTLVAPGLPTIHRCRTPFCRIAQTKEATLTLHRQPGFEPLVFPIPDLENVCVKPTNTTARWTLFGIGS